jgi:hypothetical protein
MAGAAVEEVAVGTVIHYEQRGNRERKQRWDRIRRAELLDQSDDLQSPYGSSADDVRVETSTCKKRYLRCRCSLYVYLDIICEVSEIEDMGASAIRENTADDFVARHYGPRIRVDRRADGGSRSGREIFSAQSSGNGSPRCAPIRVSVGNR